MSEKGLTLCLLSRIIFLVLEAQTYQYAGVAELVDAQD